MSNLKNKKILITAGPTWVAIDSVRVISNTATSNTGIMLAKGLAEHGAKIKLLLGPAGDYPSRGKCGVARFFFFDELDKLITKELSSRDYDIVIHSAAVSDYAVDKPSKKKIGSGKTQLQIKLKPLPKIIDKIRKLAPKVFLVGFKLEPDASVSGLIREGKKLMARSKLDLVVANIATREKYSAYIISKNEVSDVCTTKGSMVKYLISKLENAA